MSGKISLTVLFFAFLFAGLLIPARPAQAQSPNPRSDDNCVSCHTHRYYTYDRGKWFCLCEAPMHCVYCHSGRTDAQNKEIAHEGLVLHPTRELAERCQTCHAADYLNRVVAFGTIAGIDPTPQPVATATPVASTITPVSSQSPLSIRFHQLQPWRLAGLGTMGIAFVLIMIFGFRCYRADCLTKMQ